MKCRSVKPNPWEVRRKCTVFGLGHEKASSSGEKGPPRASAKILHSADSFSQNEDLACCLSPSSKECAQRDAIILLDLKSSYL